MRFARQRSQWIFNNWDPINQTLFSNLYGFSEDMNGNAENNQAEVQRNGNELSSFNPLENAIV